MPRDQHQCCILHRIAPLPDVVQQRRLEGGKAAGPVGARRIGSSGCGNLQGLQGRHGKQVVKLIAGKVS